MEEKEVENRSIRCVGCLYWDWNRYHLVRLDVEVLGPVEAEIRRLKHAIDSAKRERQQRRQSDPNRLVEQAIGLLKKVPAVLKDGDDQQVKAFLQTAFQHMKVWTRKTGSGNKTRYSLARGEIHFASPTEQEVGESPCPAPVRRPSFSAEHALSRES